MQNILKNYIVKDKEYYNKVYKSSEEYKKDYSEIIYYPIYKEVLKHLNHDDNILELGCGCGQFSDLLEQNKFPNYLGLDFSEEAISQANKKTLYSYLCKDITVNHLDYVYDTVIALEVFEHLNYKDVLKNLKSGVKIIFSVPNFLCDSHIHKWNNEKHIRKSFNKYIYIDSVSIAMQNKKGSKWFLINGIVK